MDPLRVLFVDDSSTFVSIAARFLSTQGGLVLVGAASGGKEALTLTQELQPDVILLDLAMPGMSGLEAIPRLREIRPAVGIIALTLMGSSGYREAALSAGADDFVTKADLTSTLVPAILRVGQTRRLRTQSQQAGPPGGPRTP
jgi:CheY-like chemotaxis protein